VCEDDDQQTLLRFEHHDGKLRRQSINLAQRAGV